MDELTTKETILFDGLSGDAFTRILDGERPEEVPGECDPFYRTHEQVPLCHDGGGNQAPCPDEEFSSHITEIPLKTIKSRLKSR